MPKIVDYAGRFAFFELASFTLVRDHGVDHLSRHALARVLATSIHALVDGLGVAVCLGRVHPDEAVVLVRDHLARVAGCPAPSP